MNANLIDVKTPQAWGCGKENLGILQDHVVFLARNEAAYNPPGEAPLQYPMILLNATTGARKEL